MLRSCSREGHDFSHSLVETLVAAVPQEVGQVAVRHLVLVVTHLVVHSEEVVHVHLGAHFDSGRGCVVVSSNNESEACCHVRCTVSKK